MATRPIKRLLAAIGLKDFHVAIQSFENLAEALSYQGMVINDKNFHNTSQSVTYTLRRGHGTAFVRIKKSPPRRALGAVRPYQPPCSFIISGTISSATMLMILISGLTAGPAVSL